MMSKAFGYSRRDILKAGATGVLALPFLSDTAQAAAGDLPFLVVGDWGWDGDFKQKDVALQMGRAAAASGSRFVLSVGDNFYQDGVASADDPHFQASFEGIYTAPSLQTPWHVILGNHDYRGNVDAQIAYAKTSSRWRLPARYYARGETLPDGSSVDFFHLDTSPFVTRYLGTNTKIDGQDAKAQLAWFEGALAGSSARWKIVVGHHPVFSGGRDHGSTPELLRDVKPLLDRLSVTRDLSGLCSN